MEPIHIDVIVELYNNNKSYFNWLPREIFTIITDYFNDDIITNACYIEELYTYLCKYKNIQIIYTIDFNGKPVNIVNNIYINKCYFYRKVIYETHYSCVFVKEVGLNDIFIFKEVDEDVNCLTLLIGNIMCFDNFKLIRCYPKKNE